MEICPLSLECILSERGSFYSRLSPRGICGNLTFKITIQKFIHYIQKFIRFVVALILMFHIALCFVVCDCKDSDYFLISKNYFTFFDKNCYQASQNFGALSKNFGAKNFGA